MGGVNGNCGDGELMLIENNISSFPHSFFISLFFLRKTCGKHLKMNMTLNMNRKREMVG